MKEAKIIPSGEVISLSTPTSLTSLFLFGKGVQYDTLPNDELYNPLTPPPPRPTISNLQWLSGTQYLSLADLDLLIAGPDRPPSKAEREEIEAIRQEQRQARVDARMAARVDPAEAAKPAGTQGGIWAGLQKGFSDRTKSLGLMGESMDRLGESSKGFSDEVARLVKEQKKKALIGGKWWGGFSSWGVWLF